jgi:hypothetical protein
MHVDVLLLHDPGVCEHRNRFIRRLRQGEVLFGKWKCGLPVGRQKADENLLHIRRGLARRVGCVTQILGNRHGCVLVDRIEHHQMRGVLARCIANRCTGCSVT